MARYQIKLTDGSTLPMMDERNGDHVDLDNEKFLFIKGRAQSKLIRIPWTSVLKVEETIEEDGSLEV